MQQTTASRWTAQHKQVLIVSAVTLLVLSSALAYYLYHKRKKQQAALGFELDQLATSIPTSSPISGRLCRSSSYPINYGTCMEDVKILQRYLIKKKKANLGISGVDGKFGPKTKAAAQQHLGKTSFTKADITQFKQQLNV